MQFPWWRRLLGANLVETLLHSSEAGVVFAEACTVELLNCVSRMLVGRSKHDRPGPQDSCAALHFRDRVFPTIKTLMSLSMGPGKVLPNCWRRDSWPRPRGGFGSYT